MCTRLVYIGPDEMVVTGRSMDFSIDIPANLWIFPRGIKRNGNVGNKSLEWQSKYGSLVASSWDIAVPDGMNEKGLVANLLWLTSSQYQDFDSSGSQEGLTISAWAQYVLDNFATVSEAVNEMRKESFTLVSDFIPGTDKFTTVHLSISDASGDSAIFEYINKKLTIHHNHSYKVMTNDPPFEQQLAIKSYWSTIPGEIFLPGTSKAQDRFVRASYYLDRVPQTTDRRVAIASVFSIIRNVSVPYGISTKEQPHLSNTRWRVVADQKNKTYYFENVLTPNVVWVDLMRIKFEPDQEVKKLTLSNYDSFSGLANDLFLPSKPFDFKGI
ncbi:linear amide C-N hydrolase [Shewanella algae]|nr:linear amide C-N hydrolase [Shewanella algae]